MHEEVVSFAGTYAYMSNLDRTIFVVVLQESVCCAVHYSAPSRSQEWIGGCEGPMCSSARDCKRVAALMGTWGA